MEKEDQNKEWAPLAPEHPQSHLNQLYPSEIETLIC